MLTEVMQQHEDWLQPVEVYSPDGQRKEKEKKKQT